MVRLTQLHRIAVNEWRGVPSATVRSLAEDNQRAIDRGEDPITWGSARDQKLRCLEAREALGLSDMDRCRPSDPRFAP